MSKKDKGFFRGREKPLHETDPTPTQEQIDEAATGHTEAGPALSIEGEIGDGKGIAGDYPDLGNKNDMEMTPAVITEPMPNCGKSKCPLFNMVNSSCKFGTVVLGLPRDFLTLCNRRISL